MDQTVWRNGTFDDRTASNTILVLRSDGTYTKHFGAAVGGFPVSGNFGGTHEGTWHAEGSRIFLSGDGNWPPYIEDLQNFTQLEYL